MNLRAQLDNVDVQQEDGTIINLGENMESKKTLERRFSQKESCTQMNR